MSKYFTLRELCRSKIADAKNIGNDPPPEIAAKLENLAVRLLDPVRELWGAPLTVNSGYRSPRLNRAVGGSSASQHLAGEAADLTTKSPQGNRELFERIVRSGIAFDQLIDEQNYAWLHISYREGANRRQVLHL